MHTHTQMLEYSVTAWYKHRIRDFLSGTIGLLKFSSIIYQAGHDKDMEEDGIKRINQIVSVSVSSFA